MSHPDQNPERGVLISLAMLVAGGILILAVVIGSLWPKIVAFFS